jgi:uncharacterized membrane protein YhaH (DUF805 family)
LQFRDVRISTDGWGERSVLKALFGDVRNGRLMRLQYVGYSLLLSLLMVGVGLVVVAAIGLGEDFIAGDLQQAQEMLRERLTLPYIIVFAVATLLFMFVGANIMAKRIRDIGLPGWWSVLGLLVLFTVMSYAVPDHVSSILQSLLWLALSLIPGNSVAGGSRHSD